MSAVDAQDVLSDFDRLVIGLRRDTQTDNSIESVVYGGDTIFIDDFKANVLTDSIRLSSDGSNYDNCSSTSSNIDFGPTDNDDDDGISNSNCINYRDRLRATAWKRYLNVGNTCLSEEGSNAYLSLTKVCFQYSLISYPSLLCVYVLNLYLFAGYIIIRTQDQGRCIPHLQRE